jgi:dipeptidyl aminopeptidase/acylaminoacyl peptidase
VAADDGANAQIIQAIDPATGAVKATYTQDDPPTAQIASLAVAPKGGLVAINLNAGNRSEVRILDANKLTLITRVRSPFGQATLTRFSDDGSKLGLTLSQADVPGDVFSVDARTGLATPLRHDPRPGLESVPPQSTSITQTPGFDGLSIPINVYLPANAHGRLPVIVNFHGGPSSSSEVKWSPMIRFFSALGYAVVEPNVRGSAGFGRAYEMADNREKRADWLKDVETMNTWAKAQTWADPQRVTVMGGSYGGYTVLMALTRQPTLWRAGVDLAGVANLFTFLKSTDQGIRADFVQEFGDLDADKALLDEFSPMRDADKIAVPLFIYAGKNDPRVPLAEADQVVVALRKHGVPVEYMVSGNEGHSIDRRENRIEYLTRVARFLDDNAGGVAPAR